MKPDRSLHSSSLQDDWTNNSDISKYNCTVLKRNDMDKTYTVELVIPINDDNDDEDSKDDDENEETALVELKGVPQYGIQFVNKPYTSSTFIHGAFRHEMMILDHIFPEAWKNIK